MDIIAFDGQHLDGTSIGTSIGTFWSSCSEVSSAVNYIRPLASV